ncbi:MAG: 2,3-bisphosphoglycerate-independent phosphoglycerate mutase [Actinomycetota bacterium]|nr:2,3-bisphosphoglycerate-independent phosphoglycerate mutase [Actinomycetota bacterium]MDI7252028.1 2,3-bisphosphoglycerate-independent phosphoglycerate mutase [Actinomycetota bacterium]
MEFISSLRTAAGSKMVLLVLDGLGGLPHPETGLTELETARTPNLDALARDSACGLIHAVGPGITPGSGPAHMALFGYDPVRYEVGRGVLSALGVGMDLGPDDLAARVNFCTVEDGVITDRRAGRIPTEKNARLCEKLSAIRLDGAEVIIRPEKEHRAALVLRGEGLSERISDTDPQKTGVPPLPCRPLVEGDEAAERTAALVNKYLEEASRLLADEHPANMLLTRGFARKPDIPLMTDLYGIRAGAVATYPMYRAVARLVGMELVETGPSFADQVEALAKAWEKYDYFFVHYKYTDSRGEDGDFDAKVACIEEVDASVPRILELQPEVLVVTGDHSTPALLKAHSWHPSPLIFHSRWERRDDVDSFGERACARGILGTFPALDLLPMMLACAQRLTKFGA